MSHHTNRSRKRTMDNVLKIMAQAIIQGRKKSKKFKGLANTQIVAYLSFELGSTRRKIGEYLEVLQDAGRIEFDPDQQVWKLPE